LDFPKANEHIYFVSDPKEVKAQAPKTSIPKPSVNLNDDDDDDFEDVESDHEDEAPVPTLS